MKASSRKKRAALRTHRRILREEKVRLRHIRLRDAYLAEMWSRVRDLAQMVRPAWITPEEMDQILETGDPAEALRTATLVHSIYAGELPKPPE